MEKLKIIALLGRARAGKDTAGQMLIEMDNTGKTMAFADKLKNVCSELFDIPVENFYDDKLKTKDTKFGVLRCYLCGKLECEDISTAEDKLGSCKVCGAVGALNNFKSKWSHRTILQHVGTEGLRRVWPDVWANYAIKQAARRLKEYDPNPEPGSGGMYSDPNNVPASFVVITDCRFKNEVEAIINAGGEVWRIRRPSVTGSNEGIVGHASELEQDSIPDSLLQAVIDNNSTLDSFRANLSAQFDRFKRKYAP